MFDIFLPLLFKLLVLKRHMIFFIKESRSRDPYFALRAIHFQKLFRQTCIFFQNVRSNSNLQGVIIVAAVVLR